jgi:hypothetical protein
MNKQTENTWQSPWKLLYVCLTTTQFNIHQIAPILGSESTLHYYSKLVWGISPRMLCSQLPLFTRRYITEPTFRFGISHMVVTKHSQSRPTGISHQVQNTFGRIAAVYSWAPNIHYIYSGSMLGPTSTTSLPRLGKVQGLTSVRLGPRFGSSGAWLQLIGCTLHYVWPRDL